MDVIDMPDLRRNLRDHERRTRPPLLTRVLDGDCCVHGPSAYFSPVIFGCIWPVLQPSREDVFGHFLSCSAFGKGGPAPILKGRHKLLSEREGKKSIESLCVEIAMVY